MHNKHFILHLTLLENIGPAIIQKIQALQRSGVSTSDLYLFSPADWQQTCGFTDATVQKLVDGLANKKILDTELELIAAHNIQWTTVEDETYPHLLREIYLPPAVIYSMGAPLCARPDASTLLSSEQPCLASEAFGEGRLEGSPRAQNNDVCHKQKILSVVGARKADNYGERVVNAIVPDLVAAGYTIVSGGALGIDTMAHEATLKSGGKTVAVLGSGLLIPYPSSNRNLFKSIVEHGGSIVSIFPLTMEALPGHFPARNRIITGLSRGCLVVQAAKKSGALISAHYALEQGREVFAVPGLVGDELSAGCNALIQSGAKLVMNAADILEEFGDRIILPDKQKTIQLSLESAVADSLAAVRYGSTSSPRTVNISSVRPEPVEGNERIKKDKYSNYSSQQKLIIFACKQPSYFDSILNATQLTSETVQSELFNLQLDGVVSQDFTGMWQALRL